MKLTEALRITLKKYCVEEGNNGQALVDQFPRKWEKHGNLVLFPQTSFTSQFWDNCSDQLWKDVCGILKCEKLGRKLGSTKNDEFRSPRVQLLFGSDPWALKKENNILYTWNVTKCMFSSGNLTEKFRISKMNLIGKIVVDLFAGIGYFTLSYLIYTKAEKVIACEWNPNAVEALTRNLDLNNVSKRCSIIHGDNKNCPKHIGDHINLGILPTSEGSYDLACSVLKRSGGVLHIHELVNCKDPSEVIDLDFIQESGYFNNFQYLTTIPKQYIAFSLKVMKKLDLILREMYGEKWNVKLIEIFRVKSYAPHIDHVVFDVSCYPSHVFINNIN